MALFFAEGVPSLGYKTYELEDSLVEAQEIDMTIDGAENKFFKLEFNEKGLITSFYQKETGREILKTNEVGNELIAFEDKPMNFDNWDIDMYYTEKSWKVDDLQSIEVIEKGPVRATLKIERKFSDSTIIQKIYVYKDIPRVDFNSYVDWKEHQILLKVAFPIDINVDKATYEIQYGNVERATHSNTSWDAARFEVCAQKWADLSEADFGVSLLNDCKYGHDIKEGVMRLTLIKSGIEPNPTTDQEEHKFTYSLYPHSGDWRQANTTQMAYKLNVPMYTKVEVAHEGSLLAQDSIAKVNKENVIIEVVKKAEDTDEIIIRMYEFHNKRSYVKLQLFSDIENVAECNLMEENSCDIDFKKNEIEFEIKPYEIKSFKIKLRALKVN